MCPLRDHNGILHKNIQTMEVELRNKYSFIFTKLAWSLSTTANNK